MKYIAAFSYLNGVIFIVTGLFDLWPDRATAYAFASCMFGVCASLGAWQ
jgi:hypothetical protein